MNLHPALLELLTPIHTTGDGNCFWNAVSILLCGTEELSVSLRFLTACGLLRKRDAFISEMESEHAVMIGREATPETYEQEVTASAAAQFNNTLRIALTRPMWAENEHFQGLALGLGMPIYLFSVFDNSIDPTMDCARLQQHFDSKAPGTFQHMVYCSKDLYQSIRSKRVCEFDHPPLCVHLYSSHFTALMYKSSAALESMPVLYTRRYRRI